MDSATLNYFSGDSLATNVWLDKYQLKDSNNTPIEETPDDMHLRLAREFAEVEYGYRWKEENTSITKLKDLSKFGSNLLARRTHQTKDEIVGEFFDYMKDFKHIVPQGSIMANLGNERVYGCLSNCFTIASPEDSYGGIMRADEELVQLMKRRGGVGTTLNNLRPESSIVTNTSRTSTGAHSFMERFSESTREVAQDGRRGALMLLLHVNHPDIFKFVTKKNDKTKVTGANVSVMFTDEFMNKVEKEEDFICRFPVGRVIAMPSIDYDSLEYNVLHNITTNSKYVQACTQVMKIKAKELYDTFTEMSWKNGEPGAAYIDRIQSYCPDGVYERYIPSVCNPCGEQWFSPNDSCRLITQNLFSIIDKPFTEDAEINTDKLYEVSYMQQRMSDNLIDLEVKYINRIIDKIQNDPEDIETKRVELNLWKKIKSMTLAGRRTGNGITGLADMLAAFGVSYDSDEAIELIEEVMQTKMEAELDATIDMAILRGSFEGWDKDKEFDKGYYTGEYNLGKKGELFFKGKNSFYEMLIIEFPEQAKRMYLYGRRNVSWSTVAPTGTVSLMTQTTSGIEPLFKAWYTRRVKIVDDSLDVDFIDQSGDKWKEYYVLHPKFKDWIENNDKLGLKTGVKVEDLSKENIEEMFRESPYYKSQAEDISWEKRIEMQAVIQRYTSNSISSTINLPEDIEQEVVSDIFMSAWKKGLKGITVYREGSRTGVLLSDTKLTNCDDFGYTDAIKRPKELEADFHHVMSNGKSYGIIVGKLNGNPYELFAFSNPLIEEQLKGKIVKVTKGIYQFQSEDGYTIDNLQLNSDHTDEKLLTRWVSLLLRHGASPKFIAEQVEKSHVQVVSFPKAVARILKTYIVDESISEVCSNCGNKTIRYEEGCKKCTSCGESKC